MRTEEEIRRLMDQLEARVDVLRWALGGAGHGGGLSIETQSEHEHDILRVKCQILTAAVEDALGEISEPVERDVRKARNALVHLAEAARELGLEPERRLEEGGGE